MHILFVCQGNTCRSPMAEAVFRQTILERKTELQFTIDSAGVQDWHEGEDPNPRTIKVLEEHSIPVNHKARMITKTDFLEYDLILAMDYWNIEDLEARVPANCKAKIELFGAYDHLKVLEIEDPIFDPGMDRFYQCYEQCVRSSNGLLDNLTKC